MPRLKKGFPQRLITVFTHAVSSVLLIGVYFMVQYLFDKDFVCSCKKGEYLNGLLYIFLPPVILAWLVNITKPIHRRRIFSLWCFQRGNVFLSSILNFPIDYVSLGVIWITAVFFDGDWYLCIRTNLDPSQTGIPCRSNLTDKESRIKDDIKATSLNIGLGIMCSLISLWFIYEQIRNCYVRSKICNGRCCSNLSPLPYYRGVYEDLLDEKVSSHLKTKLSEIAEKRAEAICEPFLEKIEAQELQMDNSEDENRSDIKALGAWWNISEFDFHLENSKSRGNT
ncbi:uncharacterized protein LOC117819697 [Xyrichtys novacula]|uniref:Uncharacterized protein LOC117819697 n=1 Tax=Xyrichtys novacula TaxID=13765 RepID=A0AAV1GZ26_XYRNO|nr:uncharacterized protein LOC117819697 [Xyrichtys novacula]